MLWTILFLLTVLLNSWLFWILTRNRCSTQSRDASTTTPEDIFIAIVVMLVLISWLGLLLAELGLFSLAALTGTLIAVALGLIVWLRKRQVPFRPSSTLRLDRFDAMAVLVAVIIGVLYARPSEWIGGGDDPAVYVSIGVNIARTGSILIHDQTLDDIDPEQMQALLYITEPALGHEGVLFPGFYLQDRDRGMVVPQFFHVFPVWIAILYSIGGIGLAMFATPLFGWLSVLTIYLIGRRLIHPGAGVLAMALLGLNISQLWFSRVPFADIVLQFCLLGGFWTLALLVERDEQEHPSAIPIALLSGACFGLCHLVKADAFVVPVVVFGFVACNWLMGMLRRSHVYFLGVYVLLTVHAVLHGYLFSLPYITALFTEYSKYIQLARKGLILILPLLLLVAWQRERVARFVTDLAQHREKLGRIFVLFVLLLSLYAYFVRPFRADLGAMAEEDWARKGAVTNWLRPLATTPGMWGPSPDKLGRTFVEEGIVRLGWYFTPLGVWLGVVGFVYWVTTKLTLKSAPLLGGAFLGAIIAFYRGAIMARYFWAFKRYVPLVVPTFVLFVAFLLHRLWPTDRSRWQGAILPLFAACFLLTSFIGGSMMFWEHVEFEGAIEDIATLSNSLPQDSVLLFHFSSIGFRLSTPMTYLYGHDAFMVYQEYMHDPRLHELITGWYEQERPVYWLTPLCSPLDGDQSSFKVSDSTIHWPHIIPTLDQLPDHISAFDSRLCIYRLADTEHMPLHDLDVNFDDQIRLRGYKLYLDYGDHTVAGGKVYLVLYWEAQQDIDADYVVFTHVLDNQSNVWGQMDDQPVGGARPTSSWKAGQVIADPILIPIQPDTSPGEYTLQVGLYSWPEIERLPVLDDLGQPINDHVVLETITITHSVLEISAP
ncbi:MAG: hypothetical protein GY832_11070 [Chloroflexi bacterium]|nr:hypothetical protein [Chloroflexota bacterium]